MQFQNTIDFALQLDAQDPVKQFRERFLFPRHEDSDAIYFLGNSLGLQPKTAAAHVNKILKQWQEEGVESFFKGNEPWMQLHDQLTPTLSKIVGSLAEEVVVMNGLTVNVHLLLTTFYQPKGKWNKIICEAKAFCSDQYALETHVKQRGLNPGDVIIEIHPRPGEVTLHEEDILSAIDEHKDELALVFFGGVNYYTGQVFDLKKITHAAHNAGACAGFDLAHAAGNVQLNLHDDDVDFACWCSYKYLNSGPGAIAGAYVHERFHKDESLNRLGGWWGYNKATRFKMAKGFDPIPTAEGWQLSTPPIVLYALHKASLEVFAEAGFDRLLQKGQLLSDYLLYLLNHINASVKEQAIHVLTPANAKGCQVSMLMLQNGKAIFDTLAANGIYADWREPDVIRVAPVALYNTFTEVFEFATILKQAILDSNK
jgi:kynureninase